MSIFSPVRYIVYTSELVVCFQIVQVKGGLLFKIKRYTSIATTYL